MPLYSLPIGVDWVLFARGPSLEDFELVVPDAYLTPGSKVRLTMDVVWGTGYLFNAAGVEELFKPRMPAGLILDDVRGKGASKAVIEAHVASPSLGVIVAAVVGGFILITLAGMALTAIVLAIKGEFLPVAKEAAAVVKWMVVGGVAVGGILLVREFVRPGGLDFLRAKG